ncbi:hypothetical protein E8E15_000409 [Penicillium rubens]|nr:hypothetical protein E8E15_000409 [Penicillium rubens]
MNFWIRNCSPNGNGWSQINPLSMVCPSDKYKLSTSQIRPGSSLTVVNRNKCNDNSSNLEGASPIYDAQKRLLEGDDDNCGPRDLRISCEFSV